MNDQQIITHLKNGGIVGFRLTEATDPDAVHARLDTLSRLMGRSTISTQQPGPVPAIQAWIEDTCTDDQDDPGFVWANGDNDHEHAD